MADHIQLDSLEDNDRVPELPTASEIAEAGVHHRHRSNSTGSTPPISPVVEPHNPLTRQQSAGSHVDIGLFDPEGVMQLRRTLSRQSQQQAHPHHIDTDAHSSGSVSTDHTLASDSAPFDFEKKLRDVIKRCAIRPSHFAAIV